MVRVYAGGTKLGSGLAPTLDRGPKRGLSLRQGEREILTEAFNDGWLAKLTSRTQGSDMGLRLRERHGLVLIWI